ncbi:CP family cyanate transporter-like MFS transporter [Amycolatopsis thermophila]|uniref:CP family cyanate transporter-like MFS transporter n=1 Tax=Amycolatopsis thermophila TaxID=206084 RepID=A0ABU0EN18_9PSEU|nr:MFS transporter [Amycolatopsis thermophila]MDQ0376684.1 CP family cyanate transporter-like MFS transporter [Amycolatopsis thermophila]
MTVNDEASVQEKTRTPAPRVLIGTGLLGAAVLLAALNLRPAVTSVGSVLDEMRDTLGASATWAGALTTVPGLCFAFAGLTAPVVARRLGVAAAVGVALALLSGGLVLRVLDGQLVVLGGTLIGTAGIALANVLIPVVVKESFATRIGLMTGLYTGALQAGGALGSALTPPLDSAFGGWRPGLGSWALLSVLALVLWLSAARTRPGSVTSAQNATEGRSLFRSPLAWIVTVFFGMQACLAYIVMGWLPQVLMDAGVSRGDAGLLLGLVSLLGLPVSLIVPPLAAKSGSQSGWILLLGVFGIAGVTGLMVAPGAAPLLWSIFLGIGMAVFSLALTTIALRARTGADTAKLSAMAQGIGYLLAAVGPFLFGFLHDVTGGWTVPFAMLLAVVVGQMVFGFFAGRPRYV